MSKLPSFQFYPGDWLKDPAVRSVSLAARGLWTDMLCLMHEGDRRGFLQHATGKPVTAEQLARMTGCSTDEVSRLLQELSDSGVFSCTDHGVIYSRRIVRDERKRQLCAEAGKRGGGNPTFKGQDKGDTKGDAKGDPKQKPKASSSSSSSSSKLKSKAGDKAADPRFKPLVDHFFAEFQRVRGQPLVTQPADFEGLKLLLARTAGQAAFDLPPLKAAITRFIESKDAFFLKIGKPMAYWAANINAFMTSAPTAPPARGDHVGETPEGTTSMLDDPEYRAEVEKADEIRRKKELESIARELQKSRRKA